jgi:hypothetical protein
MKTAGMKTAGPLHRAPYSRWRSIRYHLKTAWHHLRYGAVENHPGRFKIKGDGRP